MGNYIFTYLNAVLCITTDSWENALDILESIVVDMNNWKFSEFVKDDEW